MSDAGRPAGSPDAQGIRWVLVDGALRAVEAFRGTPLGQRPAASCPVCNESVILKLGRILVPHAAHRAGSTCAVQSGEGALHFNTKHAIAAALRAADPREIVIELPCVGAIPATEPLAPWTYPALASHSRCFAWTRHVWVRDWDEIRVEFGDDLRRPDVSMLRAGRVVGAIEVRVANPVDDDKAEAYAAAETPWIEIDATVPPFAPDATWSAALPLRLVAFGPWSADRPPAHFHCEAHTRSLSETLPAPARELSFAARIVDVYTDGDAAPIRRCVVLDLVQEGGRAIAVQARLADARDHADVVRRSLGVPLLARDARSAWRTFTNGGGLAESAENAWRGLVAQWHRATHAHHLDAMPWAPAGPVLAALEGALSLDQWPPRLERDPDGRWIRSPEFDAEVWDPRDATPAERAVARSERQRAHAAQLSIELFLRTTLDLWPIEAPWIPVIAVPDVALLRTRGETVLAPAEVIERGDRAAWESIARDARAAGATPLFIVLASERLAAEPWPRRDLPILMLVPDTHATSGRVLGNLTSGRASLEAVSRGLADGTLHWDESTRRWHWT
jgi:hypothetical protein